MKKIKGIVIMIFLSIPIGALSNNTVVKSEKDSVIVKIKELIEKNYTLIRSAL